MICCPVATRSHARITRHGQRKPICFEWGYYCSRITRMKLVRPFRPRSAIASNFTRSDNTGRALNDRAAAAPAVAMTDTVFSSSIAKNNTPRDVLDARFVMYDFRDETFWQRPQQARIRRAFVVYDEKSTPRQTELERISRTTRHRSITFCELHARLSRSRILSAIRFQMEFNVFSGYRIITRRRQ